MKEHKIIIGNYKANLVKASQSEHARALSAQAKGSTVFSHKCLLKLTWLDITRVVTGQVTRKSSCP